MAAQAAGGLLGRTVEPLTQLDSFISTNSTNAYKINDPVYDSFKPTAVAATNVAAVQQVLITANQHVAQQHYLISLLQPMSFTFVQPWLNGFNGQNNALNGRFGTSMLFFYPARFWIDASKK